MPDDTSSSQGSEGTKPPAQHRHDLEPSGAEQTKRVSIATGLGFVAILLWALLASFTKMVGAVPPFQIMAISFALASLCGFLFSARSQGGLLKLFKSVPPTAWLLGISGLFGFHFFYFLALQSAPAIEASLISYLWPLLIVLFSALPFMTGIAPKPGHKSGLRWWHILGALMGLAGTALILLSTPENRTDPNLSASLSTSGSTSSLPWFGYGSALMAALSWSSYSVLSRRFASVPSAAVTGFCLITAILAALCHLALEQTVWPLAPLQWLGVIGLGLGPVGLAFYVWDAGMKHGDMRILGGASYLAPLLSTFLLVALGLGQATLMLWVACALTTGGALFAAKDLILPRPPHRNKNT